MSKVILKKPAKQAVCIASTSRTNEYWQCGVWVRGKQNATKYYDAQEAEGVVLLRRLSNITYVEA